MASYLLIESRDPYEYADTSYFYTLAADLARGGNEVTFFLIQNGVLAARRGASGTALEELRSAPGVSILADEFSLRERGIETSKVAADVRLATVDELVDLLADSQTKAIWH